MLEQSYKGNSADNKQYGEARRALMEQIAKRQQKLTKANNNKK